MNNKFITVHELIEILEKVDPNLEVVIEHNNPEYAGGYWDDPTVYTNVESDEISVKDFCLILDISQQRE